MLASEWVLVLPSALRLPLAQVSPSALASAIRFRFLLELNVAVPFLLHPALKVLTQQMASKPLKRTPRFYLISPTRDLLRSTKPGFPHLARFALLRSSELILLSAQHGRARLA